VQLVVHPVVAPSIAAALPEALVLGWDASERPSRLVAQRAAAADVLLVGPGTHHLRRKAVRQLLGSSGTLLLDAGALRHSAWIEDRRMVIAPNLAEAQELVAARRTAEPGATTEALETVDLAATLAQDLDCEVAVRGVQTVVSDGRDAWSFDDAAPGLGTPGSGDVLMGVLAALLATGMSPVAALAWAVRLHADAGAAQPRVGYLASDLADSLPLALAMHPAP
jgi:NAD(P)H-hydrate repair Nnr-like enzyme with NAD(P)H-hydrate dehydratase domain